MRTLLLLGSLLALSSVSSADVFIVDASGGVGADFTDLPEAVAAPAVVDGDRLLVKNGSYSGFATNKGLSIVESGGAADVVGTITIQNLAPSRWFSMEGIDGEDLLITGCVGVVFVEGASFDTVRITSSSDVRLRDLVIQAPDGGWNFDDGEDAMVVQGSSRVELVKCVLQGGEAVSESTFDDLGDGGSGLLIHDDAMVHAALSSLTGGDGGSQYYSGWSTADAGDGGHGIHVGSAAELIVSGLTSNEITGGFGGDNYGYGALGLDGYGLRNEGSARVSGATFTGPYGNDIWNSGYLEQPASPDPVVDYQRQTNGSVRVVVYGAVGGNVRIYLGTKPALPVTSPLVKPEMMIPWNAIPVGVIGPAGNITYRFSSRYPVGYGERFVLILQASVVKGGLTTLSNSGSLMHM